MFRRLGVYRTFFTGILIGLFYVVIVSEKASKLLIFSDQGIIDQRVFVLTFSGILGGVLYTIVVDGIVELPRFSEDGYSFEAGLFGDILLGIAGAFIFEFLTSSIQASAGSSFVMSAAKGMIGGYGGKALMNVALNKFLRRFEEMKEEKEVAEKEVAQLQRRLLEGQRLLDQLNVHIKDGSSALELEELIYGIQHVAKEERTQIFSITREFRSMSSRSDVFKVRTQRTIPIFEALVSTDPGNHEYHAQLAFAYKDTAEPKFHRAIEHLNQAIRLRDDSDRVSTWKYELNRAIASIQLTVVETGGYFSSENTAQMIVQDLLSVLDIHSLEAVMRDAQANNIPTPIREWIIHNQAFLKTHRDAAFLLEQLKHVLDNDFGGSTPIASADTETKVSNQVDLPHGDRPLDAPVSVVPDEGHSENETTDSPDLLSSSSPVAASESPDNNEGVLIHDIASYDPANSSATELSESILAESSNPELAYIRDVLQREVTGVLSIQDWTPELFKAVKNGLVYLNFLDADEGEFEAFQVAWAKFKASVDRGGSNRIGKDSAALFLDALEHKASEAYSPEGPGDGPNQLVDELNGAIAPATPEVTEWDDAPVSDLVDDATEPAEISPRPSVTGESLIERSFTWHSHWDDVLPDIPTTGASSVTAKQDKLTFNGPLASNQMARQDLPRVEKLVNQFRRAAAKYSVPAPVLAAIASRESRCGKRLDERGLGDHGNAFGIMQIDKRHHTPSGFGGDPASQVHIDQGAEILANNLQILKAKFPDWEETHILKAAVAAYNFGTGNIHTKQGIDTGTTGDDYGSDVIARAKFFIILFEQATDSQIK
ncbi:MAG: transglycosylase SLT domain-containing protein [Cyanobacteria bacterium P01_E01_bin.6]